MDEGYLIDVLYPGLYLDPGTVDFSKTFDQVPYARLLLKLKNYGITGTVLKWVEAWLSQRKKRVLVCGEALEWSTSVQCNEWSPSGIGIGTSPFYHIFERHRHVCMQVYIFIRINTKAMYNE